MYFRLASRLFLIAWLSSTVCAATHAVETDATHAISSANVFDSQLLPAAAASKIAFARSYGLNPGIYLMNPDGTNVLRLTTDISDSAPAISPDGTRIAFSRAGQAAFSDSQIYVMNIDGSNLQSLTTAGGANPTWSPDGARLAFTSARRSGYSEIFLMNSDGSNQHALLASPGIDISPAWSPDGTRIAFTRLLSHFITIYGEIFVVNPDGSNLRNVTNTPEGDEYAPAWSPDSSKLAFGYSSNGSDVYVINANGSGRTNITKNPLSLGLVGAPTWSPDGNRIAYSFLFYDGWFDINVVNLDGSGKINLTHNLGRESKDPDWHMVANTSTTNPIDDTQFFVAQHYRDFLSREPDAAGLAYWTSQIARCGDDSVCINRQRVTVSAAFFIEAEFQETGYFVYRFYKASYGRQPTYAEFTADRSQVVGGSSLEQQKQAFANGWVQRPAFLQLYPAGMSNADFVNKLFDTASLIPYTAERQQQLTAMNASVKTRAQVLRDVIELAGFRTREYNPSFVLMQYFGYLRRDPEPGGYQFWLNVLNNREPGNYRGMVCAFLTSAEYQLRFGQTVTRSDRDCALYSSAPASLQLLTR